MAYVIMMDECNAQETSARKKKFIQGRPSRQASEKLHESLLQYATEHFLEFGFQGASIEGIAKSAGVSKLTIYRQYQNKHGLFLAVIQTYVEQYIADLNEMIIDKTVNSESLYDIGIFIANRWLNLQNMRLARIVIAEAHRLTGVSSLIDPLMEHSRKPIMDFLTQLNTQKEYLIIDLHIATIQFIQLCVHGHYYFLRDETYLPTTEQLQIQVKSAVNLFLNGYKHQPHQNYQK